MHPIQVVTRRTGLSADVIRAWERRYAVITPARSDTGRRLYSDADVQRLRLLAEATRTGRTIGQIAALPASALATLVEAGHAVPGAGLETVAAAPTSSPTIDHLDASLRAVERFDGVALDAVLRRAVIALSAEAFLDALVVPLWERVAQRVREGTLRPPHRHLALAVLRRALDRVVEAATTPLEAPAIVVTTPSGQPQELGALLNAAVAAAEGWRVTYVGPELPAEDIAETALHAGARAVALSLGTAAGDRVVTRELRRLRALLSADVAVLVGGASADAYQGVARQTGATVLRDLPDLRARLRSMRG
ncbi:MAG TPA: MerR family transcriptional regulator [Gemmatimonadaceae bacterium]